MPTFYAQFANYSAQNYALVSGSPYIGRATDGKNIGVDLAALTLARKSSGGGTTTNAAPSASPGGPYSGRPGTAISFNGSGSRDPDGSIASYRWDWGDGTSAGSGATPSHTFASSGTFTVRLTVTDNAGATGTATTTASIQAPSTTGAGDIVLTAADVTVIRGNWARISSTSGAGGQLMSSTNNGFTQYNVPAAAPASYFEAPFMAAANTNYQVWLRLRAPSGSKYDDSVWVQFTGAVSSQRRSVVAHGHHERAADQSGGLRGMRALGMGLAELDRSGSLPGRGTSDNPHSAAGGRRSGGPDRPQPGEVPDSCARLGEE